MQNNFSYIASAAIDQGDLVAVDPSGSDLVSIGVKPAGLGDDILGRAAQKTPKGEPISINPLTVGETISVIAGDTIAAGDHLSAVAGKVVKGGSALLAIEGASVGQKLRAVMTASDQSPAVAEKAKALDTNGQYVGGPDVHMYILNTGVPARSSANVGSDSVPMYLKAGKFTPCTSVGGGAGEYCHLDELSTRDAVKSFTLGTTVGQQVKGYVLFNANNNKFSVMWSLPEGQTQDMIVQGVVSRLRYPGANKDTYMPDVPFIVKVVSGASNTWEIDPDHYQGKYGNTGVLDCIITKA